MTLSGIFSIVCGLNVVVVVAALPKARFVAGERTEGLSQTFILDTSGRRHQH